MTKVLILGSEGQIGSHLKMYLKKKNYSVYEFDITNSQKQDLRIFNNLNCKKLIKKVDFIFFLAFDVGGSRYLKKYQNTYDFVSNNIKLMSNTFELIKKYKKKFIFASSQMSNMTYSNYGILKNIGERYSELLNGIVVKFWNVYGIEKDLTKSHVITDFIIKGIKNKKIDMLTNGKEVRDFLYAEDCCNGLEIIMKKFNQIKKSKKSIDLTTGRYTSILNIAKIIKKILNEKKIRVIIKPSSNVDTVQKNKKNLPNRFFFKFWKPKYTLENGIREIINYYI
jgi:nucleoside-diphosphate-sugar epimerase